MTHKSEAGVNYNSPEHNPLADGRHYSSLVSWQEITAVALPYLNHKQGKPWDFCFYPPIPSSSSLPTALPVLPFCHPIDLTVAFTICQWRMPAGGAPNPLSGRTTVSTLFFFSLNCMWREGKKRIQTEETGEPRSAAFESGLWKTKHNKLLLKKKKQP